MNETLQRQVIAVVGAGAIGSYLAGHLSATGVDVRVLVRGQSPAGLRRLRLCIAHASEEEIVASVAASTDPRDIGEVDFVVLCVKTPDIMEAVDALGPLLGPSTAVVTVQNGVDAPHQVAARLGRQRVLPGVIRVVATIDDTGRVRHVGSPAKVTIAEWDNSTSDRLLRIREVLRNASLVTPEPEDIWVDLWSKFLVMAPAGSLGAVTGATIGVLRSQSGTRRLLLAGLAEVYAVAAGVGISLPENAVTAALTLIDQQPPSLTTSLQRDVLAGRASEVDAWTGAVIRLAERGGCPVPVHTTLYDLLLARTYQRR